VIQKKDEVIAQKQSIHMRQVLTDVQSLHSSTAARRL
jgi:hypothetical protein